MRTKSTMSRDLGWFRNHGLGVAEERLRRPSRAIILPNERNVSLFRFYSYLRRLGLGWGHIGGSYMAPSSSKLNLTQS